MYHQIVYCSTPINKLICEVRILMESVTSLWSCYSVMEMQNATPINSVQHKVLCCIICKVQTAIYKLRGTNCKIQTAKMQSAIAQFAYPRKDKLLLHRGYT